MAGLGWYVADFGRNKVITVSHGNDDQRVSAPIAEAFSR